MRYQRDYSQVNEAGDFSPAPSGVYRLRIIKVEDGKTQAGDPKATLTFLIVNDCLYKGKTIPFHTVTLLPPESQGAGFAKHFLRVIGQPYQGKVSVDTDAWKDKEFIARVEVEDYKNKNGDQRTKNVVDQTWHLEDEHPNFSCATSVEAKAAKVEDKVNADEDPDRVPF